MGQQLGLCVEGSFQFALYGCVAVFYHFSIQEHSFVIVTAFCCQIVDVAFVIVLIVGA